MDTYDINELRAQTHKYHDDLQAKIPCPDCHHREPLTLAEDQPFAAALLSYCSLCDGQKYVSKARALAVLPYIAEHIKELREQCQNL